MDLDKFTNDWNSLAPGDQVKYCASIKLTRVIFDLRRLVVKTAYILLILSTALYLIIILSLPLPQFIVLAAGFVLGAVWISVFLIGILRGNKDK